jgi:hypothetical protein
MPEDREAERRERLLDLCGWLVVCAAGLVSLAYLVLCIGAAINGRLRDIAFQHAATCFCLPSAVLIALVVVLLLRTVAGNIQLKALGFEFQGASGPIIMWILCFLTLILAVVKTWPLK